MTLTSQLKTDMEIPSSVIVPFGHDCCGGVIRAYIRSPLGKGKDSMEILWLPPVAALLLGYLLGSIPFGLLLAKAAGVGDLREIGSGNIGARSEGRSEGNGWCSACRSRRSPIQ